MLCFASLRRLCKYIVICYEVKYAFISFYISIMFYSFIYYRCTICIYACVLCLYICTAFYSPATEALINNNNNNRYNQQCEKCFNGPGQGRPTSTASKMTDEPRVSPSGDNTRRKYDMVDQASGGETTWTNTGAARFGRGLRMLMPSPTTGPYGCSNANEDDDGCCSRMQFFVGLRSLCQFF